MPRSANLAFVHRLVSTLNPPPTLEVVPPLRVKRHEPTRLPGLQFLLTTNPYLKITQSVEVFEACETKKDSWYFQAISVDRVL